MKPKVIAITSMAGIFPGANSVEEYWENILTSRVAPLESLETKWGIPRSAYFDPLPGAPYKLYSDLAFCLKRDPPGVETSKNLQAQQHLQIRLGQRVLRDLLSQKGIALDPSSIALVLGTSWTDASYFARDGERVLREPGAPQMTAFDPGQQLKAIAEASHLGGPLLAVDTACASSLYGLDTAISLIQTGRAQAAVVMGLNVFLPTFLYLGFSKLTALSPLGELLPFARNASGIIPGEAVAAILIEPLEDALYAGRKVLATVARLGLSADGGERSHFAPGPHGQRLAYERAYHSMQPKISNDIDSIDSIDYIEAHGTATLLGDQTEISGLDDFLKPLLGKGKKIPLGSVKSLIGHTLAAAGIASIIKVLKIFDEKILPPHIPVQPHPSLQKSCLTLLTHAVPIAYRAGPIRAAINSLGFVGSNAHLILESFTAESGSKMPPANPTPRKLRGGGSWEKLVIVDFESAFGCAANPQDCQPCNFPWNRFGPSFEVPDPEKIQGSFFPDHLTMEAKGLKTGPNLLGRSDSFQLHGVELVHRILNRIERIERESSRETTKQKIEAETTGVVVCNNLGGEMALRLSRHYQTHFDARNRNVNDFVITIESIASALPSMMSGSAAYHFNLRGFHQTVSGTSAAFWNCLLSAPYWLTHRCDTLLLGGGRFLKSPLDLETGDVPGEALSYFLVETSARAERLKHKVMATLCAVVPGSLAGTYEQACAIAGYRSQDISLLEISQLDKDSIAPGSTQSLTGFLDEATGTEALAKILYSAKNLNLGLFEDRASRTKKLQAAILVQMGEQILWTLFLELEPPPQAALTLPQDFEIPLEITYQPSPYEPGPKRPNDLPRNPSHDLSGKLKQLSPCQISPAASYLAWQDSSAQMILRYLDFKKNLLKLSFAPQGSQKTPIFCDEPGTVERSPGNQVLTAIAIAKIEGRVSAELVVREDHPYFFDHPLDHVPGILIFEGVLQLAEAALKSPFHLCEVRFRFRSFCEKNLPIQLRMTEESPPGPLPVKIIVQVVQNGKEICDFKLSIGESSVSPSKGASECTNEHTNERRKQMKNKPPTPLLPLAEPRAVHKQRPENVFVSELFEKPHEPPDEPGPKGVGDGRTGQGFPRCEGRTNASQGIPPAVDHFLDEGNKEEYSLLYLLEISRQFALLLAHGVEKIPPDMPMNLISIHLTLPKPIPKNFPLQLEAKPQPVKQMGTQRGSLDPGLEGRAVIAQTQVYLTRANQVLGECTIKAQVVDRETYARQRKL